MVITVSKEVKVQIQVEVLVLSVLKHVVNKIFVYIWLIDEIDRVVYETLYEFVVTEHCVIHHHAVDEIYDQIKII